MLKVKEYIISDHNPATQTVYMTVGAEVFSALEESGTVTLFALTESTVANYELRTFEIHSTGDLFNAERVKHITTYTSSLGVRHLFEILQEGGAKYEGCLY